MQDIQNKSMYKPVYDSDHGYRKALVKENISCVFILCQFIIKYGTKHIYIYMSLVVRKPVFRVSDQVQNKPGCAITEYGYRLEISDL